MKQNCLREMDFMMTDKCDIPSQNTFHEQMRILWFLSTIYHFIFDGLYGATLKVYFRRVVFFDCIIMVQCIFRERLLKFNRVNVKCKISYIRSCHIFLLHREWLNSMTRENRCIKINVTRSPLSNTCSLYWLQKFGIWEPSVIYD